MAHRWLWLRERGGTGVRMRLEMLTWCLGAFTHAASLLREERRMSGIMNDLRQSVRGLVRRPGLTALALVTLAVGVGSTTTVFSLAEAVLFRPLPFPESDQLVGMSSLNLKRRIDRSNVSFPDFEEWSAEGDLFQSTAVFTRRQSDLSGGPSPERISVVEVGPGFFETLRVSPLLGRPLLDTDQASDAGRTIVLSESIWRRHFGADSALVGRSVRLAGDPYTVVGVLRAEEAWPLQAQVWVPLRFGSSPPDWALARSNHMWNPVGRLRPGIDSKSAQTRVSAVARRSSSAQTEERLQGWDAAVYPLLEDEVGGQTTVLIMLMSLAVFLVLLIACINVSNLLLTHASTRSRELSLRSALGASRQRLIAQLLGESLLLAAGGGTLGALISIVTLDSVVAMGPVPTSRLQDAGPNMAVLVGALVITLLASLLAGGLPALKASKANVADALKEGGAQASSGRRGLRTRKVLVVAEVALTVLLLATAGASMKGFREILAKDPGFQIDNLLTFQVGLPASRYESSPEISTFFESAQRRLELVPGVEQVSLTSTLPLGGGGLGLFRSFILDGQPEPGPGEDYVAQWIEVDPEFFRALAIDMTAGRPFTDADDGTSTPVAIVNETFARDLDEGALVGRQLQSVRDERLDRRIVGVVPDLAMRAPMGRIWPTVLIPQAQSVRRAMGFLIRTGEDPTGLAPAVRAAMAAVDPDLALDRMATLDDILRERLSPIRFMMSILTFFGAVALTLAVGGVYGLVSFTVAQQSQEIGIRMALGASAGTVRRKVLWPGAGRSVLGGLIGIALSLAAGSLLSSARFGLPMADPLVVTLAAGGLALAALAASYFPALRATRVDPVHALRAE